MAALLSLAEINALPKAELHCHLDGVLDPAMLADILRADPAYPLDPVAFAQGYPVEDYDSFWAWWQGIKPISGQVVNFLPIFERHVQRLLHQSVRYYEQFVASGELPLDPAEAIDALWPLRLLADRFEFGGAIQIELVLAFGRNRPLEWVERIATCALALHKAGLIAGVALAGPETGYPVKPFADIFHRFHEAGLGIEIHAGEWCGPESVWDALEHGFPDRIGHGVAVFQDARLLELFSERHIHIEMCPTSNLKTGSVARIQEHPIEQARQLGLNFSLNTDDPGPFGNSMDWEYQLLNDTFGFSAADFERIYCNTLSARFGKRPV